MRTPYFFSANQQVDFSVLPKNYIYSSTEPQERGSSELAGACCGQEVPDTGPLLRVPPEPFFTPQVLPRVLPLACHGSLGTSLSFSELPLSPPSNGFIILPSDEVMGVRVLCQLQGSVEMRGLIIVQKEAVML